MSMVITGCSSTVVDSKAPINSNFEKNTSVTATVKPTKPAPAIDIKVQDNDKNENIIKKEVIIKETIKGNSDNEKQEVIDNNDSKIPNELESEVTITSVHFIDVGQADCILIESDNKFMLIDAGNNDDSKLILSYLKKAGVDKLEYVIGTHPHEDHIGSLDSVINNFDIGKVIIPPITHTTKTFEDVLDAIANKGLKITKPVIGSSYTIGNAEFIIIAPNKKYSDSDSDLNNWSVGIKLINGDNSFIFNGDAEKDAEKDILANDIDIKADVLKANHHGSNTSNSKAFLDAVNPTYAVITSGKDNSYGHPHKEILDILKNRDIKIFRTDTQGTIVATSDGTTITWNTEPTDNLKGGVTEDVEENDNITKTTKRTYILNTNTKKIHYKDCRSVSRMSEKNKKEISENRDTLISQGYDPCGICNP